VVPARGLKGARVDGLVVDGTGYVVGPNALISLGGGSYVVALQEAVSPGRDGSGLVALRAYVSDPSLGLAPGTQLLVGLARAAHPTLPVTQASVVLGLPQMPAAQASLAGVPTFAERNVPLPDVPTNTLGGQAVAIAYALSTPSAVSMPARSTRPSSQRAATACSTSAAASTGPRWENSTAKLRAPSGASRGFTSDGEPIR